MLETRGIKHLKAPKYCPQANASERVNRSILAAILAYFLEDQGEWDKYIHQIASSLRSSVHQAIQLSPFEALFGLSMVQHGSHYDLLRKIHSVNEPCEVEPVALSHQRQIINEHNLRKAYLKYEKNYNLRCKTIVFTPGQTVFRRNFILSNKYKKINANLCPNFLKCRIREAVGGSRYLIEDFNGQSIGVYHAQHLRV